MADILRRVLRWLAIIVLGSAIVFWASSLLLWLDSDESYEPWNALASATVASILSVIGWLTVKSRKRTTVLPFRRSNRDEVSTGASVQPIANIARDSSPKPRQTRELNPKDIGAFNAQPSTLDKLAGTTFIEQKLPRMAAPLAAALEPRAAVLMIDVDQLTQINNRHGRLCGDEVLRAIAGIIGMQRRVRFYGRCGDDTFYIVLNKVTLRIAVGVADKVRTQVQRYTWSSLAPDLRVTCSIGLAMLNFGEWPQSWIQRSLHGLLKSKQLGGNRVLEGPRLPIARRESIHAVELPSAEAQSVVDEESSHFAKDEVSIESSASSVSKGNDNSHTTVARIRNKLKRSQLRRRELRENVQAVNIDLDDYPVDLRRFVS